MLAIDLGVTDKKEHVISFKEAIKWTLIWIGISFIFYFIILLKAEWVHGITNMDELQAINIKHGHDINFNLNDTFENNLKLYRKAMSLEFITGYLLEKSLSVDNIFVMIMIFMSFNVEKKYYHRVLFYGILGAIVLRFIFIFTASALIQRFSWILLVFGGVLIFTGVKMFLDRNKKETMDINNNPTVKFLAKHHLSVPEFHDHNFFVKVGKKWLCTPLFVVLLVIEFSDIIFAFDSIPAIFSITQDPYIVFFSNIFAILGLRSLFFMIESIMDKFQYLKLGLSILLIFIGVKMFLPDLFGIHIGTGVSLIVIVGVLGLSILASILFPKQEEKDKILEKTK